MNSDFAVEEYKVKWEYVRHVERLRLDYTRWYLLTVGAGLAYAFHENRPLFGGPLGGQGQLILAALGAYSILFVDYLVAQKRSYDLYVEMTRGIERAMHRGSSYDWSRASGAFTRFYWMIVLVGAGVFALLGGNLVSGSRAWATGSLGAGAYTIIALALWEGRKVGGRRAVRSGDSS